MFFVKLHSTCRHSQSLRQVQFQHLKNFSWLFTAEATNFLIVLTLTIVSFRD